MNMKVRKSVIAFLMATTMVGSTAVPAMAGQITVKIQATGLQGESSENIDTILSDSLDIADTGSVTAMDVLKELAAPGEGKPVEDIRVIDKEGNKRTYYRKGLLEWYKSEYGNYISAIKLDGHNNSLVGKFFGENGAAIDESLTGNKGLANNRGAYFKLFDLNQTETNDMKVTENSTWNNTVHFANYLSEKDYNDYSGWMCVIDNSTYNNGVDTVLSDGKDHTLTLDFSMMMGLDLGFDSYVKAADGTWVPVSGWN